MVLISPIHYHLTNLLHATHLVNGVDADAGAVDLDLIRVHGRVCHQDLGLLYPLGLADADGLFQDEALVQVRLLQDGGGEVRELEFAVVRSDRRKRVPQARSRIGKRDPVGAQ